ncbi:hypothetical protein ACFL0Q_09380, partial [Thermodesulfobacteriota bacterium]
MATVSTDTKCSFLLENNLLSADQLQEALVIAKSKKTDLNTVLLNEFKISKEALGQSLAHHYGVPFRAFDPSVPV